ncbi:MAG: sigma-70 family RNA polymerase sigma factor [Verrucomicrobiota bacterium]
MANPAEVEIRERLTRLWMEAEPAVRAFVFASISCFADAEDVVQKVAMTAARRFDEYDSDRSFQAWALWLAKSRVIDHYRVQGRDRLVFSDALFDELAESLIAKEEEQSEQSEALEHCVEELPEKSRKLLALRYDEGASAEDIAETMESTSGSVRVMLHRVRNLLSECIRLRLRREMPC